jgi:hypothetical protein
VPSRERFRWPTSRYSGQKPCPRRASFWKQLRATRLGALDWPILERRSVCSHCVLGLSWWGRHAPPPSAEVNSAEPPPTRRHRSSKAREFRRPSKPFVALDTEAVELEPVFRSVIRFSENTLRRGKLLGRRALSYTVQPLSWQISCPAIPRSCRGAGAVRGGDCDWVAVAENRPRPPMLRCSRPSAAAC